VEFPGNQFKGEIAPALAKLVQTAKGNVAMSVGVMVLLMVVTIVYMPIVLPLVLPNVEVDAWAIAQPLRADDFITQANRVPSWKVVGFQIRDLLNSHS